MNKIDAICVPPYLAVDLWPSARSLVERALIKGGLSDIEDIEYKVLNGQMLLWLVMDDKKIVSVVITQLCIFNGDKVGTIVVCSGNGYEHYEHMQDRLYDYFRTEGCRYSRVLGRPGWIRRLKDYRVRAVIMEKEL